MVTLPLLCGCGGNGIQEKVYNYTTSGKAWNIKADELHDIINDADIGNDPYIISTRRADDYAFEHIPGAVNIPIKELFSTATLSAIPADRKIVVYCYTGQTSSQAVALLNILGYDAYNLLNGIAAWRVLGQ